MAGDFCLLPSSDMQSAAYVLTNWTTILITMLVCGINPLPLHKCNFQVFRGMSKIIQQCWLHSSEARLTALRVKKNLANLALSKSEKQSKEEQS